MKSLMVLVCAVVVTGTAFAADHGPVFSFATPVNSEREFSFDTGIIGRNGLRGRSSPRGPASATASPLTSQSTHSYRPRLAAAIYQRAELFLEVNGLPEHPGGSSIRLRASESVSNRLLPSAWWSPALSRI